MERTIQIVPIAQSKDLWNRILKQVVTVKQTDYRKIKKAVSYQSYHIYFKRKNLPIEIGSDKRGKSRLSIFGISQEI